MHNNIPAPQFNPTDAPTPQEWNDYLTPEQRLKAIAEILATLALRDLRQKQENREHHGSDPLH